MKLDKEGWKRNMFLPHLQVIKTCEQSYVPNHKKKKVRALVKCENLPKKFLIRQKFKYQRYPLTCTYTLVACGNQFGCLEVFFTRYYHCCATYFSDPL